MSTDDGSAFLFASCLHIHIIVCGRGHQKMLDGRAAMSESRVCRSRRLYVSRSPHSSHILHFPILVLVCIKISLVLISPWEIGNSSTSTWQPLKERLGEEFRYLQCNSQWTCEAMAWYYLDDEWMNEWMNGLVSNEAVGFSLIWKTGYFELNDAEHDYYPQYKQRA
jgi:hypothetical protein